MDLSYNHTERAAVYKLARLELAIQQFSKSLTVLLNSTKNGGCKMLDYEVSAYIVEFCIGDKIGTKTLHNEDHVVDYIKRSRHLWSWYRVTQINHAIINF